MTKYHMSKNGNPAICSAKIACPLGDAPHGEFNSPAEAQVWAENELKQQYGATAMSHTLKAKASIKRSTISGEQMLKSNMMNKNYRAGSNISTKSVSDIARLVSAPRKSASGDVLAKALATSGVKYGL